MDKLEEHVSKRKKLLEIEILKMRGCFEQALILNPSDPDLLNFKGSVLKQLVDTNKQSNVLTGFFESSLETKILLNRFSVILHSMISEKN